MRRRWIGALILIAWALVLGYHARREYFRPEAERLALAARTLPPGVAYYAVYRGRSRAGRAQTEIDTLPAAAGFFVRERIFLNLPGLGSGESETRTESWYGQGLELDSMRQVSILGSDTARVWAVVSGDSLVRIRSQRGPRTDSSSVRSEGALTLASSWPMRLAAGGRARQGDSYSLSVLDPAAGAVRLVDLRVLARGSRAFPDSADTDSLTGEWMAVRQDTVLAWHVSRTVAGTELEAWVDEDGRFVETELAGGLRQERTAFELAFFAPTPGRETE